MTSNRERFEAWYLAEFWEGSNGGREMLKKEHCGGYTYAKPQELWKVWQAAQPGDGEPVAWITRPLRGSSKGKAVMCQADHTPNLELWEKPFPVYAAPPAAAHGDEAGGCRHRLADARNKHIVSGYFCVDCGAAFAAADHAAMRAQAGEGGA